MKPKTILVAVALTLAAVPATARDGPGVGFGPLGTGLSEAERTRLVEERFAATDSDGDGQLTQAELVAAAEAAEVLRRQERVARMIDVLDINDDGTVSLDEMQTPPDPADRPGRRGRAHR
jgi:hypothetical protein